MYPKNPARELIQCFQADPSPRLMNRTRNANFPIFSVKTLLLDIGHWNSLLSLKGYWEGSPGDSSRSRKRLCYRARGCERNAITAAACPRRPATSGDVSNNSPQKCTNKSPNAKWGSINRYSVALVAISDHTDESPRCRWRETGVR